MRNCRWNILRKKVRLQLNLYMHTDAMFTETWKNQPKCLRENSNKNIKTTFTQYLF